MGDTDSDTSNDDRAPRSESFDDYRNSFFYGTRSDLNLKFMAELDTADAARFVQEMLTGVVGLLDGGRASSLADRFIEWQRSAYAADTVSSARFSYPDGPLARPRKPLHESRVALVTSSGHFVDGDDPQPLGVESMSQAEAEARIGEFLRADPTLSVIPSTTRWERLCVRHGGYPVAATLADHQVTFPLGHLRDMASEGSIGACAPNAYSFVGATSQLRLRDHLAAEWAGLLHDDEVDLALLVPV